MDGFPKDGVGGNDYRGTQDSFENDRKVLYLHWGAGVLWEYTPVNSPNYTLEEGKYYSIKFTPQ